MVRGRIAAHPRKAHRLAAASRLPHKRKWATVRHRVGSSPYHMAPSILFLILGASVVILAIIFEKILKNGRKTPNFAWWHHPRWQLISSKNPGPEQNGSRHMMSTGTENKLLPCPGVPCDLRVLRRRLMVRIAVIRAPSQIFP